MIKKLVFNLKLTRPEYKLLISKKPWKGSHWDDDGLSVIKAKIKAQLVANQSCCAYCGLPFRGTRDKQIEHIAPKAKSKHPQFTFTLHNLVLSCVYCNNLTVKGATDTIQGKAHRVYSKCKFLIIHPYFDDPDDHYDWAGDGGKILIKAKNGSAKAHFTINLFSLDSEEMSLARAAYYIIEKKRSSRPISTDDEIMVQKVLDFHT